jgi:hypothetical protein
MPGNWKKELNGRQLNPIGSPPLTEEELEALEASNTQLGNLWGQKLERNTADYKDYLNYLMKIGRENLRKQRLSESSVKPQIAPPKPASEEMKKAFKELRENYYEDFGTTEGERKYQAYLKELQIEDPNQLSSFPPKASEATSPQAKANTNRNNPFASIYQGLKKQYYQSFGPIEGERKYQKYLRDNKTIDPLPQASPPQATTEESEKAPTANLPLARSTPSSVVRSKKRSLSANPAPKRELIVDVGDQVDPETGVRIPPEQVNLLNAQEVARRLANKPYEPNPHNKTAPLSDLEQGGYTVLNDLVQEGLNPEPTRQVRPPEGIGREAFERYAQPAYKFVRARTLKDRMIETVRENALKRLHDSFGDMDRQFAANRIGWNGRENILKAKMYENMNRELNQLDAETEMNLVKQQEATLGNQAGLALRNDELEHRKAIEAYRINKIEEESKKEERRRNALNAVSVGQNLRQANQEDINRKAQEFEREKKHHDTQFDIYLPRLRAASLGRPDLILPERTQRTRPEFMSTMGPGEPMRMPLAGGHPILEQTPEPSSALKDLAALGTGATGLYLKNKAIDKLGKDISTE